MPNAHMASMVFYQARGCSKVSPSSRFSHLLVSAAGHLSSWSRELRGWTEVCYGGCFPLAPGKCCYRSSQCFLFAQIQAFPGPAMTKARQLSPEGGEKCGFFLRGGHASQPQDLYRVTPLYHYICLCCCGIYLETFGILYYLETLVI